MSVSALRSPAPAASRGGLVARAQPPFFCLRQNFLKPTASWKTTVWDDFALRRRRGILGRLFFAPIVRGMPLGWAPLGAPPGAPRRTADTDSADPRPHGAPPWTVGVGHAASQTNQTYNQTSGGSLVSWPRLPRFGHFPFHFPFRGEKGSAPLGWGKGASARIRQLPTLQLEIRLGGLGS